MRPFRPCPDDFEEVFARVRSIRGCARHYATSFRKARAWCEDAGISPFRPAERARREMPLNFPLLARTKSILQLKAELRAGHKRVTEFYQAAGMQKRPVHLQLRHQRRQQSTPAASALAHLRDWYPGAYDMGEAYEQITGARFVVGRRRLSEGQMFELARMYGWQG